MSLQSRMSDDLARLFDTENGLAKQVTYIPDGGAPIDTEAVINFGEDLDDADWGSRLYSSAVAFFQEKDLPGAPQYQDEVIIDGETWYVSRILKNSASIWKLELHSDLRLQPGII